MVRPIVKWAGGKRRLAKQIAAKFPPHVDTCLEPFAGGAAVSLEMLAQGKCSWVVLSDANVELINAYRMLRDETEELITRLQALADRHTADLYFAVRDSKPHSCLDRAMRFLYLNATCFNGLYRVNSAGEFNVPIGRYAKPKICDAENLRTFSKLLAEHVDLRCEDFENARWLLEETCSAGVYFDPPYHETFTGYTPNGFTEADQVRLALLFDEITQRGHHVVLSNSDTPLIRALYGAHEIEVVKAGRAINSDGKGRGAVGELLIRGMKK